MSKASAVLFTLLALLWAPTARAWDSAVYWHSPAHGETPGGGGVIGTGSKTDFGIQCVHCHVEPDQNIDLTFTPSPAFGTAGDTILYTPGQEYQFTVRLIGEYLGLSNCPPGGTNANLFAATFEDVQGNNVGALTSDTGQAQGGNCPNDAPGQGVITTGTTLLYRDCRVVFVRDQLPDVTQWSFRWTAPPAGTGDVILYGGGVDGDCDMMSMGDDVKMVKLTLADASLAQLGPGPGDGARASRRTDGNPFMRATPSVPVTTYVAAAAALALAALLGLTALGSRQRRA